MITPASQVFGYIWSITFNSNTWVDPTISHETYVPGNWIGSPATWTDIWPSGYSKAWGKNVGNVPEISCVSTSLFVTNGGLPADGCDVEEVIPGTPPLKGAFSLTLDTTSHQVINVQAALTSGLIAHNAPANATESGGDGTSMQEILQGLNNVGDIAVHRSDVNPKNGGYTWTITFLRDKPKVVGQFGNDCQQRDSFENLCNSPGNVPSLVYNVGTLEGSCLSNGLYTCHLITILTGDVAVGTEPPGSKSVQRIYIDNADYDATMSTNTFSISLVIGSTLYTTSCLSVHSSASTVQTEINLVFTGLVRGVLVTMGSDTAHGRNGAVYTIYFFDEGVHNSVTVQKCLPVAVGVDWTISSEVIAAGAVYGMTKEQSGVINGVVQRGSFTQWYLTDSLPAACSLAWNIPATGVGSLTSYLESTSGHSVYVTRTVIGKYGVVEYVVLFVTNPGQTPSGSGNVAIMAVTQAAATDSVTYAPIVTEVAQGSTGISGFFTVDLHDPAGPRNVSFDESAARLQVKLQELTTVGKVFVERFFYPNARSGGWGGIPVTPGAIGGYEWRIHFVSNTGTYNGLSFPPGSGNIDPLTVEYEAGNQLFGTNVAAQSVTYVDGSVPIDGTFTVSFDGFETDPIRYDQAALETKYLLESLPNVGDVTTSNQLRMMQRVPGILASVDRDSYTVTVEYTTTSIDTPPDVRGDLLAGDIIRIGGGDESTLNSLAAVDGALIYANVIASSGSPLLEVVTPSPPVLLAGESLRIGADSYEVLKTGNELQVVSVTCPSVTGTCGGFMLEFRHQSISGSTGCFHRASTGDMTSAQSVQNWFNNMPMVSFNDVVVSRSTSIDGLSFVFSIYFEGASVSGDVNEVIQVNDCDGDATLDIISGTSVSIFTAVEGGSSGEKSVRVNVESGYMDGDLFSLSYGGSSSQCIAFGAEASDVANQLQSLTTISNKNLPFTVAVGSLQTVLYASASVYGIIDVGTVLNIPVGATVQQVEVTTIKSGTVFYVSPAVTQAAYTLNLAAYIVTSNSVQVSRVGTGNSTATIISYTETSNAIVDGSSAGFYKLMLDVNGVQGVTTCLKYHATAGEVEAAISRIGFDFSVGDLQTSSANHITVTRRGDGSVNSGYGYTYFLRFGGPLMKFGRSEVLGYSQPTVQVIDEGHYGGCSDLNTTFADKLTVSVAAGSNIVTPDNSVNPQGYVQAGDRVRFPTSSHPSNVYLVIGTTANSITVDPSISMALVSKELFVVKVPVAEYSVQTLQEGEDSYTYNVFFTGRHLSTIGSLDVGICVGDFQQFGGMRYGVDVRNHVVGGNAVVQQLVISTKTLLKPTDTSGYFKLAVLRPAESTINILSPVATKGYPWGVSAATIQSAINTANVNLLVTRTGFGSVEEDHTFKYTFTPSLLSFDARYSFPRVVVLKDKGVSDPVYIPGNATEPQRSLNDIRIYGDFSKAVDQMYTVTITAAVANISISDKFTYNGVARVIVPNVKYLLDNNVSISFANAHGHDVGDQWIFHGVRCDSPLPSDSVVYMNSMSSANRQITVSQGYLSQGEASIIAYRAPAVFTVADQSVEVWKLSIFRVILRSPNGL